MKTYKSFVNSKIVSVISHEKNAPKYLNLMFCFLVSYSSDYVHS